MYEPTIWNLTCRLIDLRLTPAAPEVNVRLMLET